MALPQYLATTDPEAIAAIKRNEVAHRDFVDKSQAWSHERGFDSPYAFRHDAMAHVPGLVEVVGLPGRPISPRFGDWTKPQRGVSRPHKSNEAEYAAMKALRFTPEPIPGLPTTARIDAGRYSAPGTFVHDGVAYAGYWTAPLSWGLHDDQELGEQWREVASSVWADAFAEVRSR